MSAAPRSKESVWYREHYDKVAVVSVLVFLLGSALFLLLQINEANRLLASASVERSEELRERFDPYDVNAFAVFSERIESPFSMAARPHLFLVSDMRIMSANPDIPTPIPYGAEICPWTGFVQPERETLDSTGDGIPDEWFIGFGLDPFDVKLANRDLDGDGFTVREEFEAGTSPVDPEDHPSYAYKLRVNRTAARPFTLRFQGVSEIGEGDVRFMLNDLTRDRTYFVQMGEVVEGYKVVNFEQRRRQGPLGGTVDASVLTMQREADGRTLELVVNVDYDVRERIAELTFLVDGSVHRVVNGDTLELMGQTFTVVDIRRDSVLIRDEALDADVEIRRRASESTVEPAVRPTTTPPSDQEMPSFDFFEDRF